MIEKFGILNLPTILEKISTTLPLDHRGPEITHFFTILQSKCFASESLLNPKCADYEIAPKLISIYLIFLDNWRSSITGRAARSQHANQWL